MNPITFNDPFLHVFHEQKKLSDFALKSPLIEWTQNRACAVSQEECRECFTEDGKLRLPFPAFRVFGTISKFDSEPYHLVIFEASENPFSFSIADKQDVVVLLGRKLHPLVIGCVISPSDEAGWLDCGAFTVKNSVVKKHMADEEGSEIIREQLKNDLMNIVYDFLNPHLHLAKVSPSRIPKGKSVTWLEAREHYVLLHKSHPKNNASPRTNGALGDGALIDRIAHSRRAHFRLLKSPRFKKMRGRRIWVRSLWIGPKEWTDRSGQIYKIINR